MLVSDFNGITVIRILSNSIHYCAIVPKWINGYKREHYIYKIRSRETKRIRIRIRIRWLWAISSKLYAYTVMVNLFNTSNGIDIDGVRSLQFFIDITLDP